MYPWLYKVEILKVGHYSINCEVVYIVANAIFFIMLYHDFCPLKGLGSGLSFT